jgi:cytochrome c556
MNEHARHLTAVEWRESVDARFAEGAEKFVELIAKIDENTKATNAIKDSLDAHKQNYQNFVTSVQPAVTAIETMQGGVRVLGKIGNAVAWCGGLFRKVVIWLAPVIALGATIWHFFKDAGKS